MKTIRICTCLLATALLSLTAATLRDYAPGKVPAAKNVKFSLTQEGTCVMEFGEGNEKGARAWMRQHHDFIPVGKALRITMQVRTTGMTDAGAKVGYMVQALGEGKKYLRSRFFTEYYPAADFDGEWKTMEYFFNMPDPAKTPNWQEGKILMITFEAHALKGKAEFKDFQAEVVDALPTLADYEPGKLPVTKNVKFEVKNGVCSMTFGPGNGLGSRAWMRRYHDALKTGQKLRITMQAKTTGIIDPRSKIGYLVQAMGKGRKHLASKPFTRYYPATEYSGEWKTLEYVFVMPDPAKTHRWEGVEELMITFETLTQEGKAEFKDFKAEVIAE